MKRVTSILSRVFPMSRAIPNAVLENAKNRGTKVHNWVEAYCKYLKDGGEVPIIDFEYLIYADAFKKWVKDYEVVPLYNELRLSDKELDIVGTLDMICKTKDDDIILVDLKVTSQPNIPYVELQTSAYRYLAEVNKVIDTGKPQALLHLSKTGYTYVKLNDELDRFKQIVELDKYIDRRSKDKC